MAFTTDDFGKIWASTSPLTPYEFSENNYKEGWNFVGATPPSRQMWDYLQKQNDEKAQWLYLNVVQGIPIGVVQAYAGNTVPDGWLLCDGSAVSRTDYAELYAVIGDTYGVGDGSTTFNLPNLVDKFIQGNATAGTVKSAGLPDITGATKLELKNNAFMKVGVAVGAFAGVSSYGYHASGYADEDPSAPCQLDFCASRSNPIYGNSTTVQPPALTMQYIIKY
jgi:hypothetical protein